MQYMNSFLKISIVNFRLREAFLSYQVPHQNVVNFVNRSILYETLNAEITASQ